MSDPNSQNTTSKPTQKVVFSCNYHDGKKLYCAGDSIKANKALVKKLKGLNVIK